MKSYMRFVIICIDAVLMVKDLGFRQIKMSGLHIAGYPLSTHRKMRINQ